METENEPVNGIPFGRRGIIGPAWPGTIEGRMDGRVPIGGNMFVGPK